jgi:hypothetical protein
MRFVRLLIIVGALFCALEHPVEGRVVRQWPDEELMEKADLVVIATPVRTRDIDEHLASFSYFRDQPVIGVETTFAVSGVLKGDAKKKQIVLHHYRPDKMTVINGPGFVAFQLPTKRPYRLFLVREADGRYVPVAGQEDADLSVRKEAGK